MITRSDLLEARRQIARAYAFRDLASAVRSTPIVWNLYRARMHVALANARRLLEGR